jgi:hypothetical protein
MEIAILGLELVALSPAASLATAMEFSGREAPELIANLTRAYGVQVSAPTLRERRKFSCMMIVCWAQINYTVWNDQNQLTRGDLATIPPDKVRPILRPVAAVPTRTIADLRRNASLMCPFRTLLLAWSWGSI